MLADPAALAEAGAYLLAGWLTDAIGKRGGASLALSGGDTPRAMHARLAAEPLRSQVDWARVDFYFGDERAVPTDHPASNFRMARESLFEPLRVAPERIHRMQPERQDGAEAYAALLPETLDVLVLGMGPDGHTASLFPRDAALRETSRRVIRVWALKPPAERLTIGPGVIAAARQVLVLVTGADKAAAVVRALTGPWDPHKTPAQLARAATWLIDRAAGTK